jgi:hypothetical protein
LQDYIVTAPICIIWGDEDNQAPPCSMHIARCPRA